MARGLIAIVESRLVVVISIVVIAVSFCSAPPQELSGAHAEGSTYCGCVATPANSKDGK